MWNGRTKSRSHSALHLGMTFMAFSTNNLWTLTHYCLAGRRMRVSTGGKMIGRNRPLFSSKHTNRCSTDRMYSPGGTLLKFCKTFQLPPIDGYSGEMPHGRHFLRTVLLLIAPKSLANSAAGVPTRPIGVPLSDFIATA